MIYIYTEIMHTNVACQDRCAWGRLNQWKTNKKINISTFSSVFYNIPSNKVLIKAKQVKCIIFLLCVLNPIMYRYMCISAHATFCKHFPYKWVSLRRYIRNTFHHALTSTSIVLSNLINEQIAPFLQKIISCKRYTRNFQRKNLRFKSGNIWIIFTQIRPSVKYFPGILRSKSVVKRIILLL